MAHEVLKKFDRYFLIDCVAQGGMAEIFRACRATLAGTGKLLVIKRILPGQGKDEEFRNMFKSEIKVMMGFNHPNIIQLYDFGEFKGKAYIAMEYVDGKNLRQFITRSQDSGGPMRPDVGAYIISQAAAGLHYAHTFKNKITGNSLNIVHRDVSPQNILISYDGTVKVIDFGIAKAETNNKETRVGIIKGKPSYLSPEQITGDRLDGRSDIFSLGTVLWECLTGRKLFSAKKGENEYAVLKLIESCDTFVKAPSTLNPEVPKDLDYIVLKSLAKDRNKRYQSADEFHRALHKFIYSTYPDFNPLDVSLVSKQLFKNDISEDRKNLQRLNAKVHEILEREKTSAEIIRNRDILASDRKAVGGTTTMLESGKKPNPMSVDPRASGANKQLELPNESRIQLEKAPDWKTTRRTNISEGSEYTDPAFANDRRAMGTNANVNVGPGNAGASLESSMMSNANDMTKAQKVGSTQNVPRRQRPQVEESGFNFAPIIALVLLVAAGMGLMNNQVQCKIGLSNDLCPKKVAVNPKNDPVNRTLAASEQFVFKVKIVNKLGGEKITVNGEVLDTKDPKIKLDFRKPIRLVVERDQFFAVDRQMVIDESKFADVRVPIEQLVWEEPVTLKPKRFGFLTIRSANSISATAEIVNRDYAGKWQPWKEETPVSKLRLPVGTYNVTISNDLLQLKRETTVTVLEGQTEDIIIDLMEK